MSVIRTHKYMQSTYGARWYQFCHYCEVDLGPTGMYYCYPCKKAKNLVAAEKARLTKARNKWLGLGKERDCRTVEQMEWRVAVGALTKKAVKLGLLPALDGAILCVDCQRRAAACYDHRDYSQPLLVAPVCLPCNASRHKGLMPQPQTFGKQPQTAKAA